MRQTADVSFAFDDAVDYTVAVFRRAGLNGLVIDPGQQTAHVAVHSDQGIYRVVPTDTGRRAALHSPDRNARPRRWRDPRPPRRSPRMTEPLLPPSREVRRHAVRQAIKVVKEAAYAVVGAFAALADAVRAAAASLRATLPRLRQALVRAAYKDRRRVDRTLLAHPSLRGLDDYLDTFYSPA